MNVFDTKSIIRFLRLAAQLKSVKRQGWIDRGVAAPESSADHSWMVALMAWLIASEYDELDADNVLLMALLHDLPEALAGDSTPFDRHRSKDGTIQADQFGNPPVYDESETRAKHQRERDALGAMVEGLPPAVADHVVAVWEDYAAGYSREAQFVRQLDKLETLMQAELYADNDPTLVIDSFRLGADRDVTHPELRDILEAIQDASKRTDTDDYSDGSVGGGTWLDDENS